MDRRGFLKSAAAGAVLAGGLAKPAIGQTPASRVLRFIPHADVANFDPIWNQAYIARNAGLLVWDTLYGVDAALTPRRQMVESEEVSDDGLIWTFRLRPGLKFHDGEPVLAKDVVASVNRWSARDTLGQMIKGLENELVALDDRSFRWTLKKPFPKLLLAVGKIGTPCCFIMPERIARTDPFKQIGEYIGSGPARFVRSEWAPGSRAVFERFADYNPRSEPASWMAGGKRLEFDRIEWHIIPDPSTAGAALQSGEVDWWERALPDLLPMLKKNRKLTVDVSDDFGQVGVLAMNHLYPPFNDVLARRAVLAAISQEEYMSAYVGTDRAMWKAMPGFFSPGGPLYTEAGGEILKGPRDLDAAKRLLAESGYKGEPIVCLAAQDVANQKAFGDVTAAVLRRIGMNVEFGAVDWGTVVARRAQKTPPREGGWHLYHTGLFGVDVIDPTQKWVRAAGDLFLNGWAKSAAVETEIAAWFDARTLDDEKAIVDRINKAALDHVVYAPLGVYLLSQVYRTDITGVARGPSPFFWGVRKAG